MLPYLFGVYLACLSLPTDTVVVEGVVVDNTQGIEEGIPNAGILLEHTNQGVFTDVDGKFRIKVVPSANELYLIASFIGYENQKIRIDQKQKLQNVKITLRPDKAFWTEFEKNGHHCISCYCLCRANKLYEPKSKAISISPNFTKLSEPISIKIPIPKK